MLKYVILQNLKPMRKKKMWNKRMQKLPKLNTRFRISTALKRLCVVKLRTRKYFKNHLLPCLILAFVLNDCIVLPETFCRQNVSMHTKPPIQFLNFFCTCVHVFILNFMSVDFKPYFHSRNLSARSTK